jgi:hypothetical protein
MTTPLVHRVQASWDQLHEPVNSICIIARKGLDPFRVIYRIPLGASTSAASLVRLSEPYELSRTPSPGGEQPPSGRNAIQAAAASGGSPDDDRAELRQKDPTSRGTSATATPLIEAVSACLERDPRQWAFSAACQAFLDECAATGHARRQTVALAVGRRAEAGDVAMQAVLAELETSSLVYHQSLCIAACMGRGADAFPYLLRLAQIRDVSALQLPALLALTARLRSCWCPDAWAELRGMLLQLPTRSFIKLLRRLVHAGTHRQVRRPRWRCNMPQPDTLHSAHADFTKCWE